MAKSGVRMSPVPARRKKMPAVSNGEHQQHPQHGQGGVNIRVARAEHHSARRVEKVVHAQPNAVSDQQEENAAQRHQVRASRPRHHRTARRDPHAAFRQIQKGGAEQAADDGDQRQVVEKPRVGQLKQVEAQIAAEERVRDTHHGHLPRAQIGQPMPHSPLAHDVAGKEHAAPDQPAEKRAETLQGGEVNLLAVDP